jgi:hypothetical protein
MDDFEWTAILHTPGEGLDQDGSFGVNCNGIEGNFSQSDFNGVLNQEDMQTLSHQNGFWTTNIQEDACAPDVAPQTFDHSSVGDISHLGETPDTMNQNSANGFSNENIHGIGVSTHWFGSGTQVERLEILDASVYGSSDSELGIFNRTFHQGSFSDSFMADQQCSNIPILQLLQQDTISIANSNGIQSLNNTFSVHDGPSRNGLESFADHQGSTGDLVPNDSNDCFFSIISNAVSATLTSSVILIWGAFTELRVIRSPHNHMFQLCFLSFPQNLNERGRRKNGYPKILRLAK